MRRVRGCLSPTFDFQRLHLCLPAATLHGGLHDAQAGDGGVPEEVQRQEETQGAKETGRASQTSHREVVISPRSPVRSAQPSEKRDAALLSFRRFISVLNLASFTRDGTFIPEPERLCDIWHLMCQKERTREREILEYFTHLLKMCFLAIMQLNKERCVWAIYPS